MRTVSGLLLPFNVEVERWWGKLMFVDGSADEFLGEKRDYGRDVTWGADHYMKSHQVIAREGNNTLRFFTNNMGLHWEAQLVDGSEEAENPTRAQKDMAAMLDQRLALCVSAGTLIRDVEWQDVDDDEDSMAHVTNFGLSEMSTVISPAFLDAKAHKWSLDPDADGFRMISVVEFGALDRDGKRVDFDFVADRDRHRADLAAQQAPPEPPAPAPAPSGPTVSELLASSKYKGVTP